LNEDGTADQVRLLHHQINRLFLRSRQRPLFEHRASSADEIEKPITIDVLFEERPCRRLSIDVVLFNLDVLLFQKTSGVSACSSGGFPVKDRACHARILPAAG
jgi:hypothetical protein